jgi:hypothetical protein
VRVLKLGSTTDEGIAATMYALLERGVGRHPELAREMRGLVELRFDEDIAPMRIAFERDEVVVEDGEWEEPDLVITGRLPHIVHLTTSPNVGGVPNPATRHGRAALGRITRRHVEVAGDRALGRKLLRLLEL